MIPKFRVKEVLNAPEPDFYDEPEPRSWLLDYFIADMRGQEDYYLGEIAKAQAGETILDCSNNLVDAQMYPDGRVIIEHLYYKAEDEAIWGGPPARTELTLQEARQLILNWLEAKRRWYEEHPRAK